jgi:hypothetical protein
LSIDILCACNALPNIEALLGIRSIIRVGLLLKTVKYRVKRVGDKPRSSPVDLNGFAFNEPDPILDAKIATGIRAYDASNAGTIPAILLPRGMLRGRVSTADELFQIIRKHL